MRQLIKYALLFVCIIHSFCLFPQFGKNGALTVNNPNSILNAYTSIGTNATTSQNYVVVTNINDLNIGSNLTCGDLIFIYQAQGATISTPNTNQYGVITGYGNAGLYELHHVISVSGNTITIDSPLANSYFVSGHAQVIKVPQYTTLNINSLASVTTPTWNGSNGGVVVVHALDSIIVNGEVNSTGKGFRGGLRRSSGYVYGGAQYVSSIINEGGEKGESIAGNTSDYDLIGGRYCRGAPANGGGGGTNHNSGGGGGANATNGNIYTGAGVMCTTCTGSGAWLLDADYATSSALSNSSGGGKGGNTYANSNQNALTLSPGNSSWSGDGWRNVGGRGGHPLTNINASNRVYFGGGGGAADANDNSGGSGANGGGLILLISPKIKGIGKITANGDSAQNSFNIHADALGGGGGGGTVILNSNIVDNNLTINAIGGKGGSMISIGAGYLIGSGAGGGGGYINYPTGSSPVTNISGGLNGKNYHAWISEFPADGATIGGNGLVQATPPFTIVTNYTATSTTTISISSVTNNTICTGQSAIIFPSGSSNYSITPTNTTGLSFTVTPVVTTTYTIYDAIPSCASSNTTIIIYVNTTPTLSVNSPTICAGQTTALSVSSASGYTWSPSGANTQSISIQPPATTIYTVFGANGSCVSSVNATVTVNSFPVISVNNASVCAGQIVNLNATGAANYTWMPSGANTSSIFVQPLTSTIYTITGANGSCNSSTTTSLMVSPSPTLSVNSLSICTGQTATVIATSTSGYTWSPVGLNTNSISVQPTTTTIYTVSSSNGNCTSVAYSSVTVVSFPFITTNNTSVCSGQTSTLMVSGANSYTWQPSGLNTNSIVVHPLTSTIYTITGSNNICSSSSTVEVTALPSPTLTTTSSTVCEGQSGILNSTGANTYTWSPNFNLNTTSGITVSANPSITTIYTVTGTSTLGCNGSATATLSVIPLTNAVIAASATNICTGASATLNALGVTAGSYTWTSSNGNSNSNPLIVSPTSTTIYTLTSINGIMPYACTSIKTTTISVSSNITILTDYVNPICAGGYAILSAKGGNKYNWQPSSTLSSPNDSITKTYPLTTTIYTVTVSKNGSCVKTATVQVTVNPTPHIYAGNDTIINIDEYATLKGTGDVDVGFITTNTTPLICNFCQEITVSPQENTCYILKGTNKYGCIDLDTICVTVTRDWNVYIPNAFTPNGDDYNEIFIPIGYGLSEIHLSIFDRWGVELFKSNKDKTGWDGTYKGKRCEQGIYIYQAEIITMAGNSILKTGHVTLLPANK